MDPACGLSDTSATQHIDMDNTDQRQELKLLDGVSPEDVLPWLNNYYRSVRFIVYTLMNLPLKAQKVYEAVSTENYPADATLIELKPDL